MYFRNPIPFFFLLIFAGLLTGCGSKKPAGSPPEPSGLDGAELARINCSNCHLMPQPDELPRSLWARKVLPQMALRMGFFADSLSPYNQMRDQDEIERVIHSSAFADAPLVHPDDWQKISDYYLQNAPEQPKPQIAKPPVASDLPLFRLRKPAQAVDNLITLLKYDSVSRKIAVGSRRGRLWFLDPALNKVDSAVTVYPASGLRTRPDGTMDVVTMGEMDPNDRPNGEIIELHRNPANRRLERSVRLQKLQRPVEAIYTDLNGDGREDILVCQFGYYLGRLSWFENKGRTYEEHSLQECPGALRAVVKDMNGDGHNDIVVLMAQGDEQVAVYQNEKGGRFWKKTVLRFPPDYGSSNIEIVDFDGDGDPDILYTNGDNADYSYSLKRYHGVRLFRNDGYFRFRQAWFYPLHGAMKAVARDFDQDGDLDVAAIAFFPDFTKKPVESFVYLENRGGAGLRASTFPDADQGAWLTMDAADVDQDGDEDILLGSFAFRVTPTPKELLQRWQQSKTGVLLLENRTNPKRVAGK
ncbi:FG-GAP repeat domain-containing protein [Larkinella soli]|uniref:FG-GAP repeat domain-containing protein n=1 Tax=Larkinella soli TaxID=1770527 RepID=UPI000FFC3BD5|nr:VCBS repeat-containing protein [Larkinella soli]